MSSSQSDPPSDGAEHIAAFACQQCRDAKKKCDKLLPSCSRCEDLGFVCDTKKLNRSTSRFRSAKNRIQEKSYKSVTQQSVIAACRERVTSCIATDLVQGHLEIPDLDFDGKDEPNLGKLEDYVNCKVQEAASHLPSSMLMESIHRAASFQKKTATGDELFNFLDGSALIAFALLTDEFVSEVKSELNFEENDG